jgi:hypothetical protein
LRPITGSGKHLISSRRKRNRLQLAHQERNKVRRVYNRATYWPERVTMMQKWGDHLDGLRGRGKVVATPKRMAAHKIGA